MLSGTALKIFKRFWGQRLKLLNDLADSAKNFVALSLIALKKQHYFTSLQRLHFFINKWRFSGLNHQSFLA